MGIYLKATNCVVEELKSHDSILKEGVIND